MDTSELENRLIKLGCPREKSGVMASQLDRRAQQLAQSKGRPYEEALGYLLELMRQGWAARQS